MTSSALEFFSRNCKQELHQECYGGWTGLGIIATCNCRCHKKNGKELAVVESPETSTLTVILPSEEIQDDR
jgi:hypothetical protein